LALLFTFYDVHVTSIGSGAEALRLLSERRFSLALLDIQMPNITGWDLIKSIRESQNPLTRSMIVIAVTAYAMAGDRERILDAGFDGYIAKPIDVTDFMQTIQITVESRQVFEGTAQQSMITGDNS
jgi:CheY-like chemotaxis protein